MTGESTKERILSAAIELFSKKGYTETNVREISRSAGIKAGTFYCHYSSKKEIIENILEMHMEYTKKQIPEPEEIDRMIETKDAKTVLNSLFFQYKEEDVKVQRDILRVILHEQYRLEAVHKFIRDYYFKYVESYIQSVLDKLIEVKKIPQINSALYAKFMNALNVGSSVEFAHYNMEEFYVADRISRMEMLSFMIDRITDKDNEQE